MRVLVCDDEPDVRLLYRLLAESEGAEVLEATHADEAVAVARRQRLDIVLLDINMPGRSGLDVVEDLVDLTGGAVYVVSAALTSEHRAVAAARGAAGSMTKPELLHRLTEVLGDCGNAESVGLEDGVVGEVRE